jgi:hypothetical protein
MEERFGHLKEKLSHAVPEAAAQVKNELSAQLKEAKAAIAGDVINDPTYDGPHLPEFSGSIFKSLPSRSIANRHSFPFRSGRFQKAFRSVFQGKAFA